jgi:hypothetical protein
MRAAHRINEFAGAGQSVAASVGWIFVKVVIIPSTAEAAKAGILS